MLNISKRLRATWQPDMYHGWGKTRRYFEGWYIKIVDATEGYAFAFIPGISMGQGGQSHAFIQVLDGKNCSTTYHRFEVTDFCPDDRSFSVFIKNNHFETHSITLDLPDIKGSLRFEQPIGWPKMLGAPGIMGWYSFVPFMECYHGIVSLDHRIVGSLNIKGKDVNFTNGRGYIEKDWGISFPKGWIWLQTNHFFEPSTEGVDNVAPCSLIASVAHIPWLGSHFVGYIVGFWWQNQLYRFATYTGAKMRAVIEGNNITLAFKDSRYCLNMTAEKAGSGSLVAPFKGEMTGKVNESLQAIINVSFFDRDKCIFRGKGRNAGLEVAGDVAALLTNNWRR